MLLAVFCSVGALFQWPHSMEDGILDGGSSFQWSCWSARCGLRPHSTSCSNLGVRSPPAGCYHSHHQFITTYHSHWPLPPPLRWPITSRSCCLPYFSAKRDVLSLAFCYFYFTWCYKKLFHLRLIKIKHGITVFRSLLTVHLCIMFGSLSNAKFRVLRLIWTIFYNL